MNSYAFKYKKKPKPKGLFGQTLALIKSSWWVIAFCLFTYMLASQTFSLKEEKLKRLEKQYLLLKQKYESELQLKEKLLVHLDSHEDPEFLSLVLKKRLGVVPEGQIKVHFKKDGSGIQSYFDE